MDDWEGFNPEYDTCSGCGGQMSPWPGYGELGPENGKCSDENDECMVNVLFKNMLEADLWIERPSCRDEAIRWIHSKRQIMAHRYVRSAKVLPKRLSAEENLTKLIEAFIETELDWRA